MNENRNGPVRGKGVNANFQDYIENRAEPKLRVLGTIGQQHVRSTLGNGLRPWRTTAISKRFKTQNAICFMLPARVRRIIYLSRVLRPASELLDDLKV
jgi:hypothetical protein